MPTPQRRLTQGVGSTGSLISSPPSPPSLHPLLDRQPHIPRVPQLPPHRLLRAVFSNTFPLNDLIAEKNRTIGAALPYLPEWLVLSVMRGSFEGSIYPASGNNELTLAFLMEMGYGRMDKWQVVGRYRCVVEKFTAPAPQIPVMLIEADNDPLVEAALREQLKETYPAAVIHTLHNAGHFPYLNMADKYT